VKKKSVLDAFALLAYLEGEDGHAKVRDLMASSAADLLINGINLGEIYYIVARAHGMQAADHFLTVILPSLPITVVDNSFDDVIEAARLKACHAISYADCFAAALAIRVHAPIVTGDPDFRKLGKAVAVDWLG
jgi:predicted nucleic acid-binding protein